jgi:hypothetical protein
MRTEPSPRAIARATAVFFLVTLVTGVIAQGFISERLVNLNDAAKTAANISANLGLFSLGFTLYLVEMSAQIAMTVLFYQLTKPVDRGVALMSLVFGLVGCTIKIMARLFYVVAPLVVSDPALALVLLKINDHGAALALAFFGFNTLTQGWLILRSTFWPRWLGVLTVVSSVGWLLFLWPPLGYRLFMVSALIGLIGSIAMIYWLLARGVDEPRWLEQARASSASVWR